MFVISFFIISNVKLTECMSQFFVSVFVSLSYMSLVQLKSLLVLLLCLCALSQGKTIEHSLFGFNRLATATPLLDKSACICVSSCICLRSCIFDVRRAPNVVRYFTNLYYD